MMSIMPDTHQLLRQNVLSSGIALANSIRMVDLSLSIVPCRL